MLLDKMYRSDNDCDAFLSFIQVLEAQGSSASSQIDSVRLAHRLISVFSCLFLSSFAFSLHNSQRLCDDLLASFWVGWCLGLAKISYVNVNDLDMQANARYLGWIIWVNDIGIESKLYARAFSSLYVLYLRALSGNWASSEYKNRSHVYRKTFESLWCHLLLDKKLEIDKLNCEGFFSSPVIAITHVAICFPTNSHPTA